MILAVPPAANTLPTSPLKVERGSVEKHQVKTAEKIPTL
jgi:hypothetical protein